MKRKRNSNNNGNKRSPKRLQMVRRVPVLPAHVINRILSQARRNRIRNTILRTRQNHPFVNYTDLAMLVQWEGYNRREINNEIRRLRILNII